MHKSGSLLGFIENRRVCSLEFCEFGIIPNQMIQIMGWGMF